MPVASRSRERIEGLASEAFDRCRRVFLHDTPQRFAQLSECEGFWKNGDARKFAGVFVCVDEISRHQDEALGELGILPLNEAECLEAVLSRHFQVAHHEIEIAPGKFSFDSCRAVQQGCAAIHARQRIRQHFENGFLVVNHKRLALFRGLSFLFCIHACARGVSGRLDRRKGQFDAHRAPFMQPGVGGDRAVMLKDDAVGNAQFKACAASGGLRGEKGIEHVFADLRRHPRAIIPHSGPSGIAFGSARESKIAPLTGFLHSLLGVQDEVQEDLQELIRIANHPEGFGRLRNVERNVVGAQMVIAQAHEAR